MGRVTFISFVAFAILCGLTTFTSQAVPVLVDDFNNNLIEGRPITTQDATGWTYTEYSTNLTVTDTESKKLINNLSTRLN